VGDQEDKSWFFGISWAQAVGRMVRVAASKVVVERLNQIECVCRV
jgi:hypothetical protein